MTDDLVKRLRDTPNWMREGFQDWKDNVRTYDRAPFEAADRIQELETLLWAADYDAKEAEAYAGELKAKLEKAVDALGEAIYLLDPDEEDIAKETGLYRIVKTYEELKGEM